MKFTKNELEYMYKTIGDNCSPLYDMGPKKHDLTKSLNCITNKNEMTKKELKQRNKQLRNLIVNIWEVSEKSPKHLPITNLIEAFINSDNA